MDFIKLLESNPDPPTSNSTLLSPDRSDRHLMRLEFSHSTILSSPDLSARNSLRVDNPNPDIRNSPRLSNPNPLRSTQSETFSPRSGSQIERTVSLRQLNQRVVGDIAKDLLQDKAPSKLLQNSLQGVDDTINSLFDFVLGGLNYKGTLLHFVCSIGATDSLKQLFLVYHLKLDVLDANNNLPIHLAQVNGYSEIVALLLLRGATPVLFPGNVEPKNAIDNSKLPDSVKEDLRKIWTVHNQLGPFGIAVAYPVLVGLTPPRSDCYGVLKDRIIPGMRQENCDIELPTTDKQNLLPALTKVLQSEKYILDFKELDEKIKNYFEEKEKEKVEEKEKEKEKSNQITSSNWKISPLQVVAELFSINIQVYIPPYNSLQRQSNLSSQLLTRTVTTTNPLTEYVFYADKDYMKDFYPIVYLSYDGRYYYPIVHNQESIAIPLERRPTVSTTQPSTQTQSASHLLVTSHLLEDSIYGTEYTAEQLCQLILEEGPVENLQKFLRNCQHTHINKTVKNLNVSQISVEPSFLHTLECTPLYLACRLKRYDYVMELLKINSIVVHGEQEGWFGNTLLHAVSWRGPPELLALLLCNGHVTGIPYQLVEPIKRRTDNKTPIDEQNVGLKSVLAPIWDHWEKWKGNGDPPEYLLNLAQSPPPSFIPKTDDITIRKLCQLVESPEPPTKEELRSHVQTLLSANVNLNALDALFRCTLFFLTCRKGHLELVQTLLSLNIRPDGVQEAYSGHQNTPLHVVTWRGHVNLVAMLLTRVPIEAKRGGNLKPPNTYPEINYTLPKRVRNHMDYLFDLKRKGTLNEHTDFNKLIKEFEKLVIEYPQHTLEEKDRNNISTYVTNERIFYHTQLEYIWYEKKTSLFNREELILADLTIASQLDLEYRKYLKNKNQVQMQITVYSPPCFTAQRWTPTIWKMNWNAFEATNVSRRFYPVRRVKTWYWLSEDGNWIPFPYDKNEIITKVVAESSKVRIYVKIFRRFFRVDGALRTCTLHINENSPVSFATTIIHEEELNEKCNWEPDQFENQRRNRYSPNYPADKATLVELDKGSPEYNKVEEAFYITIPKWKIKPNIPEPQNRTEINQIKKITKIIYPNNKEKFLTRLREVKMSHQNDPLYIDFDYTKLLWHGTGITDPSVIYNSPDLWSVQYSKVGNLYGKGTYFAANSAYSKKYAHENKERNKQMFLAQVIVGCSIHTDENGYLVDTPDKNIFDTVVGFRNNSWIYVQYASTWAFPVYLVEWSER